MVGGRLAVAAACALTTLGAGHGAGAGDNPALAASARAAARADPSSAVRVKAVSYRGYRFLVPASWPVIDDRRQARGCVRFDQHAIYLGTPRADEFCPSWLLGTTESMLIQPGPARSPRIAATNAVARQVTVRAPGIAITATFGTDPAVIGRVLVSAGLPRPATRAGQRAHGIQLAEAASLAGAGRRAARLRGPMPEPPLPASVAAYHGLGFDACTAPSRRAMSAWRHRSRYRAIGIYIGGADRACAQPNLSRSWVRAQARAGWRFIPLYAGPQAAFGELRDPVRLGLAAARDAVRQARRLGFGRGTPIYYDMEAYRPRSRVSALRFETAWTRELHRYRYTSGVYSSSDSGIVDLSRQYSHGRYAMPNVIYDTLWNGAATTRDRNLRPGQWHLKRIHQFRGNVTQRYGGYAINIDQDYLDVRMSASFGTAQATSAVRLPDGSVDVFYRAPGGRVWLARWTVKIGWSRPRLTGAVAATQPSVVWAGASVDVFYNRGTGQLWMDSYQPGGKLVARHRLAMMGRLGSAPRAVSQPGGVIDVFWHGSADDHLWHAQYQPGAGWHGPQRLGGDLASVPAPVVSAPGTTAVLWKGRDASLWCVTRGERGRWSAPRRLGMGPLGGQPEATAQPSGGIQVYWHGAGNSYVWEAFYRPGAGWLGPRDLGGHVRSVPFPVTANGSVHVLWRGDGDRLTYIRHRSARHWNAAEWQRPLPLRLSSLGSGPFGSGPFAAVGDPAAPLRVFWPGCGGGLWTASLRGSNWTGPVRLATG